MKELLEYIEKYAAANHWPQWVTDYIIRITVPVIIFLIIFNWLYKFIKWIFKLRIQKFLNQNLNPYFSSFDVYKATKYYISTKFQNVSPSEDDEPGGKFIASAKDKLMPLFLNRIFTKRNVEGKYYLLLADTGMGKTTFLMNLFIRYKNRINWPWSFSKDPIELIPLGSPDCLKAIAEIKNKENTILLLDAFDENIAAGDDYKLALTELLKVAWNFKFIILTCRTQFFPTRQEEPYETGYFTWGEQREYNFQKLYISTFNNKDILSYLLKRYKIYNPFKLHKLVKAYKIVKKCPSLMVRPMLLSYIDDLLLSRQVYFYSYQLYEALISKWVERESRKAGIKEKYGSFEKYSDLLFNFSKKLAQNLFVNKEKRKGFFIHKDDDFSVGNFSLKDFETEYIGLSTVEIRSKSLLNRTADGIYKFSHKSILEYFIAKEIVEQKFHSNELNSSGLTAAQVFYKEMAVEIFRNYDGKFAIKGFGYQLLYNLRLTDIDKVSKISLSRFINVNPDLLKCFPSLTYAELSDPDVGWLYRLYLMHYDFISRFRLYEKYNHEEIKDLNKEKDRLMMISGSRNLTHLNALKQHIENVEYDTCVLIDELLYDLETNIIERELREYEEWMQNPNTGTPPAMSRNEIENIRKAHALTVSKRREISNKHSKEYSRHEGRLKLGASTKFANREDEFSVKEDFQVLENINSFLIEIEKLESALPECQFVF